MMTATGIPPHIKQASLCQDILTQCEKLINIFECLEEKIEATIDAAIEKNATANGHLTVTKFAGMVDMMKGEIMSGVESKNRAVLTEVKDSITTTMKLYRKHYTNNNSDSENLGGIGKSS